MKIFNIRKLLAGKPPKEEILDPVPIAIPSDGYEPESIHDIMKRFIREEIHKTAPADAETFEEADDFDDSEFDDELLDLTPYELACLKDDVLPPEAPQETFTGVQGSTPADKPVTSPPILTSAAGSVDGSTSGTPPAPA